MDYHSPGVTTHVHGVRLTHIPTGIVVKGVGKSWNEAFKAAKAELIELVSKSEGA